MYKFLIGLVVGILATTMIIGGAMYNPTLIDYCKEEPKAVVQLNGGNLTEGVLYLECNGKVYQAPLEVEHQYIPKQEKMVMRDNDVEFKEGV